MITSHERPIRAHCYRAPETLRGQIKKELETLERTGIIKTTKSAYAFPILMVKKQDGTHRMCVDYRQLNEVTLFDPYPMPRADEIIEQVGAKKYLSMVDLTKGYYQVPLSEKAKEKSAFCTPFGTYQFEVMPFGMQNSAATFMRLMNIVLKGADSFAKAYIDDVIIFSDTWQEHLKHIHDVFDRFRRAGLTVKPSKCYFGMNRVSYLGFVVGEGKVSPQECKIKAIKEFPRPQTKKQVRSFLGLVGYYRIFIPNFSTIACPLTELTKKTEPTKIRWNKESEGAFQMLKSALMSENILMTPDYSKDFVVQTDASNTGIGAVISQVDDSENERPIA